MVVGGTFDHFHRGHKAILKKAISIGKKVVIGLVTDELAGKIKPYPVEGFEERRGKLIGFLKAMGVDQNVRILPLNDPYGISVSSKEVDCIVVSEETKERAIEINRRREKAGLKPLHVIVMEMVLADDGAPISSTRIRNGIINENGKVIGR